MLVVRENDYLEIFLEFGQAAIRTEGDTLNETATAASYQFMAYVTSPLSSLQFIQDNSTLTTGRRMQVQAGLAVELPTSASLFLAPEQRLFRVLRGQGHNEIFQLRQALA